MVNFLSGFPVTIGIGASRGLLMLKNARSACIDTYRVLHISTDIGRWNKAKRQNVDIPWTRGLRSMAARYTRQE